MRKAGERLEELYTLLHAAGQELMESVAALNLQWEGNANRAFLTAINEDYTEMLTVFSYLWDMITDLDFADMHYQTAEGTVERMIQEIRFFI